MALTKGHLARLRRALRPHLDGGWERAVFSTPERDGAREEKVAEGPGSGGADEAAIAGLLAAAEAAAQAGFFKQTVVLDARRRVQVDARHGRALQRSLD